MKIIYFDSEEILSKPTVVCLGQFDGIHLGHQALIKAAQEQSMKKNLTLCVHTFTPPPASVLHPDNPPLELTGLGEKATILESMGVSLLAVRTFTKRLRDVPGEDYFKDVLIRQLNAKHLVAGFHHRFGANGDTDISKLQVLCDKSGIGLTVVPPVTLPGGLLVSSTAIRSALEQCDYQLALSMLGHSISKIR